MQRVVGNIREFHSFSQFLKNDYQLRQTAPLEQGSSLSIRRYGQLLGVDASTLSQAMRGRRRLSGRQVQTIGRKLGLPDTDLSYLIEVEVDASSVVKTSDVPAFQSIDNWRYDAVLEHLDGKPSTQNFDSFSSAIGLTGTTFKQICADLKRSGLLGVSEGLWVDHSKHASSIVSPIDTADSARRYQRSLSETSLEALEKVPPSKRNHTSIMLQIEESDLPAIIGVLKSTRRAIARDFQNASATPKHLYALQIALFPLLASSTEASGDSHV